VIDHVLLIDCFQAMVAVSQERALILDVVNDHHGQDAQRVVFIVIARQEDFDTKHGNDPSE
jgi:hypothetical protein